MPGIPITLNKKTPFINMNSQEYIEVTMRITPFSEENAEILTAEISELPFESFATEGETLKCYIQKELYDPQALKVVLNGAAGYGFDLEHSANLIKSILSSRSRSLTLIAS